MAIQDLDLNKIVEELERPAHVQRSPTGLKFNPFPATGIGGGDSRLLPPLDPAIIDRVREFLDTALRTRHFTGLAVVGDFGFGKTHLLRWLENLINSANVRLDDHAIRAYYVSNPAFRPMETLMAVIRAIGQEEFRKMIWAIVADDLRRTVGDAGLGQIRSVLGISDDTLFPVPDEAVEALVHDDTLASLGLFLQRYGEASLAPRALRDYVTFALTRVTDNLDVVRALTSLLLDSELAAFTSWVSLSSAEVGKPLRVPQQEYFRAILRVLKENGIGHIFLLIDEFEDVVGARLTARQRAEYLATLRLLIDENVDDFSLVLAMVPAAWEVTQSLHPPLTGRMGSDRPLELRQLNQPRAEDLVRRYLALARDDTSAAGPHDLTPFTPESIAVVRTETGGNTRAFVGACYRLLERYWTEPEITKEMAQTALGG